MITEPTKEGRMADLISILNDSCQKYYSPRTDEDILISDAQYDRYLSELIFLENETGIRLQGSPTMKVGFMEPEENKVKHFTPILSLKDTKNIDELLHFLGEREALLSWKLDGISIVLYYAFGTLQRAVTRGDGSYGKDITKNVMMMRHVPLTIPIKNNVIVRGEGCLSLNEFDQLKKTKEGEKYSNTRSMASGLINSSKTHNILLKHLNFICHTVVLIDGEGRNITTRYEQFRYLKKLGFKMVECVNVMNFELKIEIDKFTRRVEEFDYPVDGLVLTLNDIEYGDSLGTTAKFPKHSMAFKWPDEIALTRVTGMKWSVSQTGLITPVVLFEPVYLEGTEVKQANLHTMKIFQDLMIGIGDALKVFKANKIIPEVEENLTRSGTEKHPEKCPKCGWQTIPVESGTTTKLYCYECGTKQRYGNPV